MGCVCGGSHIYLCVCLRMIMCAHMRVLPGRSLGVDSAVCVCVFMYMCPPPTHTHTFTLFTCLPCSCLGKKKHESASRCVPFHCVPSLSSSASTPVLCSATNSLAQLALISQLMLVPISIWHGMTQGCAWLNKQFFVVEVIVSNSGVCLHVGANLMTPRGPAVGSTTRTQLSACTESDVMVDPAIF